MSNLIALNDHQYNINFLPGIPYSNELKNARELEETVDMLEETVPEKNNEEDPTLLQLNGSPDSDEEEEGMWFEGQLNESSPQTPPMSPSIDTSDWSSDIEEIELLEDISDLIPPEAPPTPPELTREELENAIEKDNECYTDFETQRVRQSSPDRPSDMDGPPKLEAELPFLQNPTGFDQKKLEIPATPQSVNKLILNGSGPLTPDDVVIRVKGRKKPPPPPKKPPRYSSYSTRFSSSRLSITSDSSDGSPGKRPKAKGSRRTKMEMEAMSDDEFETMRLDRNRRHAQESAARKKAGMAHLEANVKRLKKELKLAETENLSLEKMVSAENWHPNLIYLKSIISDRVEAGYPEERKELEEDVGEVELELEQIEIKKLRKILKPSTLASQKCRTNKKLEMANLKLEAHELSVKIDTEWEYGEELREILEFKGAKSESAEPIENMEFSTGGQSSDSGYDTASMGSQESLAGDDGQNGTAAFQPYNRTAGGQHGQHGTPPLIAGPIDLQYADCGQPGPTAYQPVFGADCQHDFVNSQPCDRTVYDQKSVQHGQTAYQLVDGTAYDQNGQVAYQPVYGTAGHYGHYGANGQYGQHNPVASQPFSGQTYNHNGGQTAYQHGSRGANRQHGPHDQNFEPFHGVDGLTAYQPVYDTAVVCGPDGQNFEPFDGANGQYGQHDPVASQPYGQTAFGQNGGQHDYDGQNGHYDAGTPPLTDDRYKNGADAFLASQDPTLYNDDSQAHRGQHGRPATARSHLAANGLEMYHDDSQAQNPVSVVSRYEETRGELTEGTHHDAAWNSEGAGAFTDQEMMMDVDMRYGSQDADMTNFMDMDF